LSLTPIPDWTSFKVVSKIDNHLIPAEFKCPFVVIDGKRDVDPTLLPAWAQAHKLQRVGQHLGELL
jgi:hypothetical protein